MRLSLSSAAASDASLAELLAACNRRGLAALELVEGHAHGVSVGIDATRMEALRVATRDAGIEICAIYRETLDTGHLESAACFAATLEAPLVVPAGAVRGELLCGAAHAFAAAGARLLLTHGSDPAAVEVLQRVLAGRPDTQAIGLAWEVRPERDDPALMGGVLRAVESHLRCVRLHGGGPEAAQQTGRGVGTLMGRLTLARYAGPLVLTPSTPRYHYVWRAWLGRAGGWGCGSKQSDPSLVTLEQETHAAEGHT